MLNKSFFKFLFGFLAIILVSFGLVIFTNFFNSEDVSSGSEVVIVE